jgi:hypothetical protein
MCHHVDSTDFSVHVLPVGIRHAVVLHPVPPHLRRVSAFPYVLSGGVFRIDLSKLMQKSLCVIGEFLWWRPRVIVISDSDQNEDMESRYLLEVTVAAEFAALPKLLDRWHCVPVLFFDILPGRVLSERTIDEVAEILPPLVVFFEILQ